MKRKIMTLATTLAILQSPAAAQRITNWDEDQNGEITRAEFVVGFQEAGFFGIWDRDADNSLTALELAEGLYSSLARVLF